MRPCHAPPLFGVALAALLAAQPARADRLYHCTISPGPTFGSGAGHRDFTLAGFGDLRSPWRNSPGLRLASGAARVDFTLAPHGHIPWPPGGCVRASHSPDEIAT